MSTISPVSATSSLPLAEHFFLGALTGNCLAHAYILKGKTYGAMYNLALQVAQVLNCKNRPAPAAPQSLEELACGQCTDCRWIAQNAHPAVLTVSRHTFLVNDKDPPELLSSDELEKLAKKGNWPTLIKTGQISRLIYQLGLSTEHVRVVIFTDAEELPESFPANVPAPCEWRSLEATEDRTFHIRPLERRTFNAASVNKFLKTLEEPLPNTLFFFITKTEEQLLETIVSRCQVLPCSTGLPVESDGIPPETGLFLEGFVNRLCQGGDVYAAAGEFQAFMGEQAGLSTVQGLEMLQRYLRQRYVGRMLDEAGFSAYRHAHEAIEEALRMLNARTNEGAALIQLLTVLAPALGRLQVL